MKLVNFDQDPVDIFKKWFDEAKKIEINDPNAMILSTVSKNSFPSSRVVLLKYFDKNGFIFYSNCESKKGISLKTNPYVALNFYWKSLKRQVRIEGKTSFLSNTETDEYFKTRPFESRIGAWTSKQSKKLESRKILIERFNHFKKKFKNKIVTRPNYWIGYKVKPKLIEFWQEKPYRLHDRTEFKKNGSRWSVKKLYP